MRSSHLPSTMQTLDTGVSVRMFIDETSAVIFQFYVAGELICAKKPHEEVAAIRAAVRCSLLAAELRGEFEVWIDARFSANNAKYFVPPYGESDNFRIVHRGAIIALSSSWPKIQESYQSLLARMATSARSAEDREELINSLQLQALMELDPSEPSCAPVPGLRIYTNSAASEAA